MSKRRVVITGLGIVSPVGIGIDQNWQNITAGVSGIGPVTLFDAAGFPSTIAGQVDDFDATDYLSAKDARKMDRFIQLGELCFQQGKIFPEVISMFRVVLFQCY